MQHSVCMFLGSCSDVEAKDGKFGRSMNRNEYTCLVFTKYFFIMCPETESDLLFFCGVLLSGNLPELPKLFPP